MINPISLVILTEEKKEAIIQIISKINEIIRRINELDRKKNYTLKSPVEEAEEMYQKTVFSYSSDTSEPARYLYEAIQYLKEENEKLKKFCDERVIKF